MQPSSPAEAPGGAQAIEPPAERTLRAVGVTDVGSVKSVLWPGFLAGSGETGSVALEFRQDVDMGRLLAGVAAAEPADRPDLVIVTNPMAFASAGLLTATPGLLDGRVPATWTDADGRWAPLYVQPIVVIYNSLYRMPPAGWEALLDPAWRGRFVLEEPGRMLTSGPALAELKSAFGERGWRSFVEALADQDPLTVADNERAVLEVATGSRWAGLSNWNVARRVRLGSPVRHVFLDPTPCIPGFGARVAGGREPELAAAFLRWLASDAGQRAYAATGRIPALPGADDRMSTDAILPRGITALTGTADWLTNPGVWVKAYRELFAEGRSRVGKLA